MLATNLAKDYAKKLYIRKLAQQNICQWLRQESLPEIYTCQAGRLPRILPTILPRNISRDLASLRRYLPRIVPRSMPRSIRRDLASLRRYLPRIMSRIITRDLVRLGVCQGLCQGLCQEAAAAGISPGWMVAKDYAKDPYRRDQAHLNNW